MLPAEIRDTEGFRACLREEHDGFERFHELLQIEQRTLLAGDVDRLVEITRLKSERIDGLNELSAMRARYLARQGVPPSEQAIAQWLDRQGPAAAEAKSLWHDLMRLAHEAQRINQENGAMIDARLRNNQQALNVLQAAANKTSLYGPDGHTHMGGGGRRLGKV